MKISIFPVICSLILAMPLAGQIKSDRDSGLNSDPDVVYVQDFTDKALKLKVIKSAPVYSDKEGNHRLGYLKTDQLVDLEGFTERAYRVRGQGTKHGIAGWVAPWAFSHSDKEFEEKLKKLYKRQIAIREIIANGEIAIGMTPAEVSQSRGEPTKTSIRLTKKGESGSWEFIDFHDIKHYTTRVDPISGQAYRTFSHTVREEKGKTVVEFEDGLVSAVEESENKGQPQVKIIVPPLIFGW
jgi:hypothetical protein